MLEAHTELAGAIDRRLRHVGFHQRFGAQINRPARRSDRVLRRLEALLAVADRSNSFLVSGNGDIIEPDDGILAIGSGGSFALSAARALVAHTTLPPAEIVRKGLEIAADICIYTNRNITVVEPTA